MYRALNEGAEPVRGVLRAQHERDLEGQLKQIGYTLINCKEFPENRLRLTGMLVKGVKRRDLIQMFVQLEQLLKVGVPLLGALNHVASATESQKLHDVLMEVMREVSEGKPISEALRDFPWIFDRMVTVVVAGSEETGNLEDACHEVVRQLKWEDQMARKVRKATRYPKMLLAVVLLVVWIMMKVVVPQVTAFLLGMGQKLPPVTQALISTSDFVVKYGLHMVVACIGIYLFIKIGRTVSRGFLYMTDAMILRLPVIGDVVRKIQVSRFCQMVGTLFSKGLNLMKCLEVARTTTDNVVISDAMKIIYRRVEEGHLLSEALVGSGEFPALVTQMVKIGEESGNLTNVLQEVSEFYDKDVDDAVDGMIALIEPALTVILGGLVVWMAAGVFGPVYDSFGKLNM